MRIVSGEWENSHVHTGALHGAQTRPHLKVALAFPDVVLQQKVVLQGKAAVLIVQLRQEVVEADGGERDIIGGVLPRWKSHTLLRGCVTQTKPPLPSILKLLTER